jgi:hypothetical protein
MVSRKDAKTQRVSEMEFLIYFAFKTGLKIQIMFEDKAPVGLKTEPT